MVQIVSRKQARELGLKRFCDGSACGKCGKIGERYTLQGQCVECNKSAFNEYRLKNKAKEQARRKAYYLKNLDLELSRYWKNRDAINAKFQSYYRSNPEAQHKRNATITAWNKRNIEQRRAYTRNRRARLRQAPGKHTGLQIRQLLLKQDGKCAICHRPLLCGYHVDHIYPLALGGGNDISNIQLTHASCNCRKGAKPPIVQTSYPGREKCDQSCP